MPPELVPRNSRAARALVPERSRGRQHAAALATPQVGGTEGPELAGPSVCIVLAAAHLALSTVVVGTPMAVASRASVSRDGVCRPASTRAMFGR